MPKLRDMRSPTSSTDAKWRRIVLSVNTYWECLDTTTTWLIWELIFMMIVSLTKLLGRLTPSWIKWLLYQTFWVYAHWQNYSPPSCSCRTYWRLHISQSGHLLEIFTSTLGTSHMLHDVQNVVEVPVLSRKAWCTKLSSSHHIELAKRLRLLLQ